MARILAIDDDPRVLTIVGRMLKTEGHEPRTAPGGSAGIRMASEWHPDLILCDIVMPEPNGLEVLATLRRDRETASIPVIFLTGVPDPKQLRAGQALGADDYLLKPFTSQELLHAVEARLARMAFARRETQRRLDALRTELETSLPENLLAPTTALLGLSAFLRDEGASVPPELVSEVAQGIFDGSQRLQRAIEKFVAYAELERLAQAMRTKPTFVADRRSQTGAVVAAAAREAAGWLQREAELELSVEDATVRIDAAHLRRLVFELVENAAKYSPKGQPIAVVCRNISPSVCRLTISDQGPGLPQDLALSGGQPWDTAQAATPAGLGLAIVRRIVALYGAELSIEPSSSAATSVAVRFLTSA
jgi:two-component system sensor histidine kinase/response regulator